MSAADVLDIVHLFAENGIGLVIDGGWGVDALLGEQTRPHADLDIAVEHRDVPRMRALLAARGYREAPRDDSWECNFVLGDDRGHEIDVHSYTFDAAGKLVHGVPYPAASLTGHGQIGGQPVRCIPPEWMVAFHSGYPLDEDDYRDVKALCARFGIPLPAEYGPFEGRPARGSPP
ncbi:MAG: nucleotidyltransferase family protein [Anaerolineae bacterium]|nr:nucleotidyltransferase family protein [Anaerolineae bacterium]